MKAKTRESILLEEIKKMGYASFEDFENEYKKQGELMAMTEEKYQAKLNEDWKELYKEYPELLQSAQLFNEGGKPEWFTDKMMELLKNWKTPLEAYEESIGIFPVSRRIKEIRNEVEKIELSIIEAHTKIKHLLHEAELLKICNHCGKAFRAVGRKKFCCDSCRVNNFNSKKLDTSNT